MKPSARFSVGLALALSACSGSSGDNSTSSSGGSNGTASSAANSSSAAPGSSAGSTSRAGSPSSRAGSSSAGVMPSSRPASSSSVAGTSSAAGSSASSGTPAGSSTTGSSNASSTGASSSTGTASSTAAGSSSSSGGAVLPCDPQGAGPRGALTNAQPVDAQSNTNYTGLRISNPSGPCITVTNKTNVTITDVELGPCGGEAAIVVNGGSVVTVTRAYIHDSARGVLFNQAMLVETRDSRFEAINGTAPRGTAIEYDDMTQAGIIDGNCATGDYGSDVISGFQSSFLTITNNEIHANMTEPSAAAMTIGDSVNGAPGHDNYMAYNRVFQTNGVPAGVFGSSGNTLLEYNCFTNGIQAYNYNNAPFVGVTVRYNIIGPGYFVPDTAVVAGWDTNTFPQETPQSCP